MLGSRTEGVQVSQQDRRDGGEKRQHLPFLHGGCKEEPGSVLCFVTESKLTGIWFGNPGDLPGLESCDMRADVVENERTAILPNDAIFVKFFSCFAGKVQKTHCDKWYFVPLRLKLSKNRPNQEFSVYIKAASGDAVPKN